MLKLALPGSDFFFLALLIVHKKEGFFKTLVVLCVCSIQSLSLGFEDGRCVAQA